MILDLELGKEPSKVEELAKVSCEEVFIG